MPKISVVIPVYNSEKYLNMCLDSIMGQTMQDFEIIIVNDGSTDGSQNIIDDYKARYPDKITALYQENAGQAAARNKGISEASGEFISFIDSDDYIADNLYEKAYAYAVENCLDIVCFNFFEVKNSKAEKTYYRMFDCADLAKKYVLNESSPCNKLIRRRLFTENSIRFTEGRIYEDLELIPQLALYSQNIGFMDDHLYYYVLHESSTMRQKTYSPKLASIYSVVETLKNKFYETRYREELEFLYIEHLLHGAVLRYLGYEEGKSDICKISHIMKNTFPKWNKNKYFKTMSIKYKIVCSLAYFKQIKILKFLLEDKSE